MFYQFCKILFQLLLKLLCRYRVIGKENFPRSGPVIVASNHLSNWDPLMIGVAMPRQIFFVAKEELFRIPLVSALIKAWGAIPIKRGRGDRDALSKSLDLLKHNHAVGIFIEGKRNLGNPETMLKPQPGAAMLALKSGAPVVPVALINTNRILRSLKRVRVIIGKPIRFTDKTGLESPEKKEQYKQIGIEITQIIQTMYKNGRT
ncbi:MAG: 1-acyl-sn-glycerol-3-phosphate acyltransferase [Firmicutes bacterium]|nr:1-acyl-sn-glycerol-3-phosphate acyltransferase [Bacillota bacterium]